MQNYILLPFERLFIYKSKFKYLLFFALLLCSYSETFCQRHPKAIIISSPSDYIEGTEISKASLISKNLIYKRPAGFKYVEVVECFDTISRLHWMLTCQDNAFYADDGHFMFFLSVFKKLDSGLIALAEKMNPKLHHSVDKSHISQIKGDIRSAFGEKEAAKWKSFVTYYSGAKAKRMFNADTLIALPVKLKPNEYYKGKYKYFRALYIQKNGRGFVTFNCFYDEKGKKNLAKYIKGLKGVIWFEE